VELEKQKGNKRNSSNARELNNVNETITNITQQLLHRHVLFQKAMP
jgi:hypothetical protein